MHELLVVVEKEEREAIIVFLRGLGFSRAPDKSFTKDEQRIRLSLGMTGLKISGTPEIVQMVSENFGGELCQQ